MTDIEENWGSLLDYILSTVFFKPTSIHSTSKKLVADTSNIEGKVRFVQNEFPYQLELGANHCVLWLGPEPSGALPSEEDINSHITRSLRAQTGGDDFDFAWYENPKMTVPWVYHVQVFWTLLVSSRPVVH